MQPQQNSHRPGQAAGAVMVIPPRSSQSSSRSEGEPAAMYNHTRERDQRRDSAGMDYPALLTAIRNELQPLQHDVAELSQQIQRIEQRYYPKELIDAQQKLTTTILEGLKNDIANLANRPQKALNNWVSMVVIAGGILGGLSFVFQHLALH